jgi:hypothetical protein
LAVGAHLSCFGGQRAGYGLDSSSSCNRVAQEYAAVARLLIPLPWIA